MSIVVFGGMFDPPHKGHLAIAGEALAAVHPEFLFWVPCALPPHRDTASAGYSFRKQMTCLTVSSQNRMKVSDFEENAAKVHYSVDTLEYFNKIYQRKKIFLLIGSDEAEKLTEWRDWGRILDISDVLVAARPGYAPHPEIKEKIVLLDNPLSAISSEMIRHRIKKNEDISELVEKPVEEYIKKNRLYH